MRRGGLDVLVGGWLERHEELHSCSYAGGHDHINVSTRLGVLDPDLAAGSGAGRQAARTSNLLKSAQSSRDERMAVQELESLRVLVDKTCRAPSPLPTSPSPPQIVISHIQVARRKPPTPSRRQRAVFLLSSPPRTTPRTRPSGGARPAAPAAARGRRRRPSPRARAPPRRRTPRRRRRR